jgi:hypothetical protein
MLRAVKTTSVDLGTRKIFRIKIKRKFMTGNIKKSKEIEKIGITKKQQDHPNVIHNTPNGFLIGNLTHNGNYPGAVPIGKDYKNNNSYLTEFKLYILSKEEKTKITKELKEYNKIKDKKGLTKGVQEQLEKAGEKSKG